MHTPVHGASEFLDAVSSWFQARASDDPSLIKSSTEHRDAGRSTLGIEVETPHAVGSIRAWTHATCLDTDVLDLCSNDIVLSEAGPVAGLEGAVERLERFWRKLSDINRAAV